MSSLALSVVVPCYNEEACLAELHVRIARAASLVAGDDYEIVLVNDGSRDRSWEIMRALAATDPRLVAVNLSRNHGHQLALTAGLDLCSGERVLIIDADLQDPPELIPEMLEKAQAGADVVYARRIGRDESWVKRMLATAFYELMQRLARVPYQGQAGDFRLLSRRVVDTLREMPERRRFLRGMVAWVGYEQVPIEYRRAGRTTGRGASYHQLFRLAAEAFASFSDVPLALSAYAGLVTAAVATIAAAVILLATIAGWLTASLGVWTLVVVLFLGGVQLISVGILGRYLARVHEQTLRRPLYLVDRVVTSPQPSGTGGASSR